MAHFLKKTYVKSLHHPWSTLLVEGGEQPNRPRQ